MFNLRHWVPGTIRYGEHAVKWGALAFLLLLYFGQPRKYFQYIPYFGQFYNPKGRYLKDHLE